MTVATSGRTPAQRRADRARCPIPVAQILGIPIRTVADAMRRAGVDGPLTVAQARSWRAMTSEPPGWMAELFAETAARRSQREHREQRRTFEAEHATLLLADEVEQRLLAGRRIRGDEAERLAADLAFRAYKELLRGAEPGDLLALDLAALRWAGIDPDDPGTWRPAE
ncbi:MULTISPECIES: hypothetical protein [Parafrankia]|uniref:Uncharacterized protein n=1 Tax=Parafrankia soli TaxID=2599596 RepID=A0A1S1PNJ6_9ACTN|nr:MULTISPECIES: hypothetical protein [Parafrankia]OHV21474.1 hypothetical protein BBK14_26560 [Parafrankia soli]TCJ37792.1 hypothetical protein E0504_17145 [Parafrankia sp. BMG5.11]CAI7978803.1 conserved hypothetical protein [Frankia sp. Hr75.2]